MEGKEIPDIILSYPAFISDELIESELKLFENRKISVKKVEPEIFLAAEWIIPTVFGVYILKPFFNSFLTEAGKDSYQLLKKGLKVLIAKVGKIRADLGTAGQTPNKLSKTYNQSLVISIEVLTKNNKKIKLLFDNDLKQEDWEDAIEQLIDVVIENYKNYPNDVLTERINSNIDTDKQYLYAVIDAETKKVNFFDDRGMRQLNKNK